MQKIKLYLSSRSNTKSVGLDKAITLGDLRKTIRASLEKETFLGEDMLEVLIHENNFNAKGNQDAHQLSITKMEESNIVIVLYNGDSGWNPAINGNGICHDEYLTAVDEFSQMMHIMDVSDVFPNATKKGEEKAKDTIFQNDVETNNFVREFIKATSIADLEKIVLTQIKSYVLSDIENSIKIQKDNVKKSTVYGDTLHFAQLTYAERRQEITSKLGHDVIPIFKDTIVNVDAIPDNMSVSDARNLIGRPFLNELHLIKGQSLKSGVIHCIGVFGSVTELQVKNLVGFPDLAVNKTPFGYYLWDTTNHIQMFFLQKCINTNAVGTNINYLSQWLKTSKEEGNVMKRAEARFKILKVISSVQEL